MDAKSISKPQRKRRSMKRELPLHLMLIPGIIFTFVFHYIPLGGIVIAFQKFVPAKGLFGNQKWIGFDNFRFLLSLPNTMNVIGNTIVIALWKIVLRIIVPVIVALMLNELTSMKFKRFVQTVIYFPHFLSWIIMSSILITILSPNTGIVNRIIMFFGFDSVYFLGDNRYFRGTMIVTEILKYFGYGTIVYLATITSIDPTFYEAAVMDGAGRVKQTWHITLPGLRGIIILMTVLAIGNILNAGFDQIFNMYTPVVYETGDILDTMIYRMGLENAQFGPAAAAGLFKSFISTIFVTTSYLIADKCFDYRLF